MAASPRCRAEVSGGFVGLRGIGVLFGCFGRKIDGPGLPGVIIYQGNPSISPKRTPMLRGGKVGGSVEGFWKCLLFSFGDSFGPRACLVVLGVGGPV